MIEVTKNQYLLLLKILNLNLNDVFYDAKLSRELETWASLGTFIAVIKLLRDNDILINIGKEGSNIRYSIDRIKLINFIPETDIFKLTHEDYIVSKLGSKYKVWEY